MIFSFVCGYLANHFGRKTLCFIGVIACFVLLVAMGTINFYYILLKLLLYLLYLIFYIAGVLSLIYSDGDMKIIIIIIVLIYMYLIIYSLSLGPIVWVSYLNIKY